MDNGLTCVNPGQEMGVVTATVVTTPTLLYPSVTQHIWITSVDLDSVDGFAALPSRVELLFPRRDLQPRTWTPGTRITATSSVAIGYALFKSEKVKVNRD
ncbi:hypothetical protein MOKP4_42780 [Mycobacterium avium subsp. hominissuis]